MGKLYFIFNSSSDAHSIKRVADFCQQDVEIKAFGFHRTGETPSDASVSDLASFSNTLCYRKRIGIYYQAIKKLFKQYPDKDITWYYLGLDVAMIAYWIDPSRKFVYEECDLVHTYVNNRMLCRCLEAIDKHIIRKSLRTILTSEGFIDYHYPNGRHPKNILLAENKLSPAVLSLEKPAGKTLQSGHLRFSFVGGMRYSTLLSVGDFISRNFPQHEFHYYGYISPCFKDSDLPHRDNVFYHGKFKSPDDLPQIYSQTDVVVVTYDVSNDNVKYLEPNKLYEALFFDCPILVSTGTFLAKKVKRMGLGYNVNPEDEQDVVKAVKHIEQDIAARIEAIRKTDHSTAISDDSYVKEIVRLINR